MCSRLWWKVAVGTCALLAVVSAWGGPLAAGSSSAVAVETGRTAVKSGVQTGVDSRVWTEAQAEGLNLDTRPARSMVLLFR